MSEIDRSDLFWSPITRRGAYAQNYDSVGDITKAVHLVVRGRVVDVKVADFLPFEGDVEQIPILVGIIAVNDVLKGRPQMRVPGTVEVSLDAAWPDWEKTLLANLPADDDLFLLLMNDAQQRTELGYAVKDPENEPYLYWRPNGDQAVLRDIDGRVDVIEPEADRYPFALDGVAFDAVTNDVVSAVQASP